MAPEGVAVGSAGVKDASGREQAGQVSVYELVGDVLSPLGDVLSSSITGDGFGKSVAMAKGGSILAVAASDANGKQGRVQVWEYIDFDDTWIGYGSPILGLGLGDMPQFGSSISMAANGQQMVVGARCAKFDDVGDNCSGAARVYRYNSSSASWTIHGETVRA